jgi:hypothetical protein
VRELFSIAVSDSHGSGFVAGIVTLLASVRASFRIHFTSAAVKVTGL